MEISQKQEQKIKETADKYSLKLVLLFGSQVSGRTHQESDFDIAYLSEKSLSFEEEYRLNYEFTEIFQNDRVDTVNFKKAPPLLLYGVFRHPQILFQKDELTFSNYQSYAFKKYIEAQPLYEEKLRRLNEKYI